MTASFVYDGTGRREKKTVNSSLTEFLFDGINPVQETSGAAVLANMLTGLGIDEFLTRTDVSAGTTSHVLPDALGSALVLADSAGAVQTEYTYEPFGKTTSTGASNTNSFQYTGRENDGSGIYYYRARYYHPQLQRFVSEDPSHQLQANGNDKVLLLLRLMIVEELNGYAYAQNNPVTRLDPSGLLSCEGTWKMAGWDRSFNIACICYWLCVPCDGPTIWGGNYRTLPATWGVLSGANAVRRGDTCTCGQPGPQTGCGCERK